MDADLETMIWPLACRKINGIGPKADTKLKGHGIDTIGQLAAKDLQWLMDHFGQRTGAWLFDASHGLDERPIVLESEPVSISRETSFERDLHAVRDKVELGAIFTRLCEQLADDLKRKGYVGKTIGIKIKYEDFTAVTRDITIERHIADAKELRRVAGLCLKRAPLQKKMRLLGVRMGALIRSDGPQKKMPNMPSDLSDTAQAAMHSGVKDALTGQLF
jgi:DNA polymerase-4